MPVQKTKKGSLPSSSTRHNPIYKNKNMNKKQSKNKIENRQALTDEFNLDQYYQLKATRKQKSSNYDNDDDSETVIVDDKSSQKILQLAREQQDELEEFSNNNNISIKNEIKQKNSPYIIRRPSDDDDDDDEDDEDDGYHFDNDDEQFDIDSFSAQLGIDKGDEAILEKFMNKEQPKTQSSIADLILEKIKAATEADNSNNSTVSDENGKSRGLEKSELNPKIIEVYTKVGMILSRYKSGKLPKTFKIIPTLSNWEEILLITNPETWTPNATYRATRLFSSNFKSNLAQRFYIKFLLPKIKADIYETKKLNVHLYNSLKKALYKPAAFFKGFLLPLLCNDEDPCSLREAIIIGSVLTKVSIPALHSAACLIKLAELETYSGANSIFIRILLDKKYALPYRVLDALVFHFLRIKNVMEDLPVLWHQSLLVFAQRYKNDLSDDQKKALLELIKVKNHYLISPEIRKELTASATSAEFVNDLAMEEDEDDD